jgi:hypothetical protein
MRWKQTLGMSLPFDVCALMTRQKPLNAMPRQALLPNAIISISGPLATIVKYQADFGLEIKDENLLDYAIEELDIVVLEKTTLAKNWAT